MSHKTIELEISLEIRKAIEAKSLDAASAMSIVRKGMELLNAYPQLRGAEKKAVLIRVLEQVSAGNDGVLGTDDDLLPPATLKAMKALLEGDLIGDIVDTFVAFTKGGVAAVDTGKVMRIGVQLKALFEGLLACVKKTKTGTGAKKDAIPLPTMITNPVAIPVPLPVMSSMLLDRKDKLVEPTKVLYSSNV
jgi:hypothetical protein